MHPRPKLIHKIQLKLFPSQSASLLFLPSHIMLALFFLGWILINTRLIMFKCHHLTFRYLITIDNSSYLRVSRISNTFFRFFFNIFYSFDECYIKFSTVDFSSLLRLNTGPWMMCYVVCECVYVWLCRCKGVVITFEGSFASSFINCLCFRCSVDVKRWKRFCRCD